MIQIKFYYGIMYFEYVISKSYHFKLNEHFLKSDLYDHRLKHVYDYFIIIIFLLSLKH